MDNRINRRLFLGTGMAGLTALAMPKMSFASLPTDKRLVVVILRGAMDGLAAVAPYADKDYKSARGSLAITDNKLLDLDGFFGLHPSFKNLYSLYNKKELAIFHNVASPYRERSHFDAQNVLEIGMNKPKESKDGWLNRLTGLYGAKSSNISIAIGQSIPMMLYGSSPVGSWSPSRRAPPNDEFMDLLSNLYDEDEMLHNALTQAENVSNMTESIMDKEKRANLNSSIKNLGKMLSNKDGPRIATIEVSGWDTHSRQGLTQGSLSNSFKALDDGLGILKETLKSEWKNTAILVVTEFGRTVSVNGSGGTDHGTASVSFLLGGAVNGGSVRTKWTGLAKDRQFENRDLYPVTDIRQIFKSALIQHMDIPLIDVERRIFPDSLSKPQIKNVFV